MRSEDTRARPSADDGGDDRPAESRRDQSRHDQPVDDGSGHDQPATVLDAADVARITDRIAHQIIENIARTGFDAVLLGIPTRGVPLAHRLSARIEAFAGVRLAVGSLDITLYRDDLRLRGVRPLGETAEPEGGIDGRTVILVDDVLCSGRSCRAALDALTELGRPRTVQLAALVDRGHRELPIRADYVGKNLPTSPTQRVWVRMTEVDDVDAVVVDGP